MTSITVAYGDGIGPEIMEATLSILKEAQVRLTIETIEIGEKLFQKGYSSGITKDAWDVIARNKILLKAPITTPQGKGYKSLNVTFRKTLGLFANVRPAISYYPFVDSNCKKMDLVVVRENEEDLYAGIEYKLNSNTTLAYKIITRAGSERIIRYAFEYAKLNGRKKVTAFVKDNIMKICDGMFHDVFKEISKEYPDIKADSMIVDIGSARIAARPQDFDVVVTLNLYGDIISDIAAEVSGSVGLAGSANIGTDFAMFEAIHGSAPDIAGKGIANPSGLLNAGIMMLEHLGQHDKAGLIQNAWLKTIEDGIHTSDIYKEGHSKKHVSTQDFAKAVIENLGEKPSHFAAYASKENKKMSKIQVTPFKQEQKLLGVDVYIDNAQENLEKLANVLVDIEPTLKLHMITQKGLKVWPDANVITSIDILCLRFFGYEDTGLTQQNIISLLSKISEHNYDILSTQNLYSYDGKVGFTLAQGE